MHAIEQTADAENVTLPAVLDLAAAQALQATLRRCLAGGRACNIDASKVENLLLPGMQVILAALQSSERIAVVDPSAAFCTAFDDAALSWQRVGNAKPATAPIVAESSARSAPEPCNDEPAAVAAAAVAVPVDDAGETGAEPRPKRILTIDDSKTMRDMLRFTLVDAGYDVLQAVDGQDGLDVLSRERVDVVITDINMPKLDGYGVIRHLRADAGYDDTPILVLSTESDQKTKDIGRDAGATGWLVKPFDPAQLVEIVRQVSP
jgi:two-component system chemotaxis response regulator CheY